MTTNNSVAEPASIRGRELARRLRQAQQQANLDGRRLAAVIDKSPPVMSRILTGKIMPQAVDVAALLAACRVTGPHRDQILDLCDPRHDSDLLRLRADEQWGAYRAFVADTERLTDYQPLMIPWLAQTSDYTRAYVTHLPPGYDDPDAAHTAVRNAVTTVDGLRRVEFLLHESALRIPVGDPELMSEQAHHLLRLSVRPQISLRMITTDLAPQHPIPGGFTLLDFPDHPSVIYRDDPTAGLFLDGARDVATYRMVTGRLSAIALNEQQSHRLLTHIAASYSDASNPANPELAETLTV